MPGLRIQPPWGENGFHSYFSDVNNRIPGVENDTWESWRNGEF
jgi:hypothetical protein